MISIHNSKYADKSQCLNGKYLNVIAYQKIGRLFNRNDISVKRMTDILAYHKNHQKRCQNHQHILILNILFALQTFEHAQIAQASQAKRKQISGNHKNLAEYGGVNVIHKRRQHHCNGIKNAKAKLHDLRCQYGIENCRPAAAV